MNYCTICGTKHDTTACPPPVYHTMPSDDGCRPFDAQAEIAVLWRRVRELEHRLAAHIGPES